MSMLYVSSRPIHASMNEVRCCSPLSWLIQKISNWINSFKATKVSLTMDPLKDDNAFPQDSDFTTAGKAKHEQKQPLDVVSKSIDPVALLQKRNSVLHSRVNFVEKQLRRNMTHRPDWIVHVPQNVRQQLKSSRVTCEKVDY